MTVYIGGKPAPAIEIKKGIPVPKPRISGLKPIASKMEVGDSVDLPYSRTPAAFNFAKITGNKFVQRRVGNVLRVWRTE